MNRKEAPLPLFKQKIFKQALKEIIKTFGIVKKIKKLKGLSNHNFLIKINNIDYKYVVLKILNLNSITKDTNEGIVNKKLNELKICPKILINKFPHYYVIEYILGTKARKCDFNHSDNRNNLLSAITTIHKQQYNDILIDFISTNKSLLHNLEECKDVINLYLKLDILNLALKTLPPTLGFCHNDLNMNNLIIDKNKNLWCIDFEYSGFGDIFFDLSSLRYSLRRDSYFKLLSTYYKQNLYYLDYNIFNKKLCIFNILLLTTSTIWYLYMSKKTKNNYNIYTYTFKKFIYKLNSEFNKIFTLIF